VRSYVAILNAAADGAPFSNSTEGDAWMANWCDQCVHDRPAREGRYEDACQILLVGLSGKTPQEWMPMDRFRLGAQYRCTLFRKDQGPAPEPQRQVPGQLALFSQGEEP